MASGIPERTPSCAGAGAKPSLTARAVFLLMESIADWDHPVPPLKVKVQSCAHDMAGGSLIQSKENAGNLIKIG